MPDLRFGLIGAGYWSQFQMAGWMEVGACTAIPEAHRPEGTSVIGSTADPARSVLCS
jgi:hypothetical protein